MTKFTFDLKFMNEMFESKAEALKPECWQLNADLKSYKTLSSSKENGF